MQADLATEGHKENQRTTEYIIPLGVSVVLSGSLWANISELKKATKVCGNKPCRFSGLHLSLTKANRTLCKLVIIAVMNL